MLAVVPTVVCPAYRTNNSGFGLVGNWGNMSSPSFYAVAVSTDGGASFTTYDITNDMKVEPIYASFPSATVWYVSGGENMITQSSKRYGKRTDAKRAARRNSDNVKFPAAYVGQVIKTVDGGTSWTTVNYKSGTQFTVSAWFLLRHGGGWRRHRACLVVCFAWQGIDCSDENTCCKSLCRC